MIIYRILLYSAKMKGAQCFPLPVRNLLLRLEYISAGIDVSNVYI